MKLWRRAILADFSRPRLGLSEGEIRLAQRPKTGLVLALGVIGLTTSPHKSPRDGDTSEGMTGRYPDEQAA